MTFNPLGPDGPQYRNANDPYRDLSAELAALERMGIAPSGADLEDDFDQARERLKCIYLAFARGGSVAQHKSRIEEMLRTLDDPKVHARRLLAER